MNNTTPRTLVESTDSFDQDNTFYVECTGVRGRIRTLRASLRHGDDIGYWIMQHSACIKSHYTAKDYEETARLAAETPVRHGDIVLVGGAEYKVHVNGDYSDCAVLKKV